MAGFLPQARERGREPADPPVFHTAVPNWQAGDTIPFGAERMLRVVETRFGDDDLVLVVERPSAAPQPAGPGTRGA